MLMVKSLSNRFNLPTTVEGFSRLPEGEASTVGCG